MCLEFIQNGHVGGIKNLPPEKEDLLYTLEKSLTQATVLLSFLETSTHIVNIHTLSILLRDNPTLNILLTLHDNTDILLVFWVLFYKRGDPSSQVPWTKVRVRLNSQDTRWDLKRYYTDALNVLLKTSQKRDTL